MAHAKKLEDLFHDTLKDIYFAEKKILSTLPKMQKAAQSEELKKAFEIGFLIFLPFLIIDLVVSSTLMSMGMIMLPPSFIWLPFKILLFVLVDGWSLVFQSVVESFH